MTARTRPALNKDSVSAELKATLTFCLAVAALYLIGCLFPGPLDWGVHVLGFLPWYCPATYVVVCVCICIYVQLRRKDREQYLENIARIYDKHPIRFLAGTIVILVSFAYLLRTRAPLLGDSFYLLRNYYESARGISPLYPRDEPIATYYFSFVLRLLNPGTYDEYLHGFLVADLILGIGFAAAAFVITRILWTEPVKGLLGFLFLLSLAYNQLFLGYVETYPVVLFALSLYVCAAILYLHGRITFLIVPSLFLLLSLTHYLSSLLGFSLLYLVVREWGKNRGRALGGIGIAAALLFAVLAAIHFDVEQFSSSVPYSHILSITEPTEQMEQYAQAYTLFSPRRERAS